MEVPISLHNLKEFISPRVTFYSWKEYLNDKAHDESLNVCGGYECFLNHTKDDLKYIPCNKTYTVNKFDVYQLNSYTYEFDSSLIEIPQRTTYNGGALNIECKCIDADLCKTNLTDATHNYTTINATDILKVEYKSYFFDMTSKAQIDNRELNFAGKWSFNKVYTYQTFGVNSTDSLLQISPDYSTTYYPQIDSSARPINGFEHKLFVLTFEPQSVSKQNLVIYRVTPKSLAQGAAQIGGLASFMGIAILVLRFYHRTRVNAELADMVKGDAKEVFSCEAYSKLLMQSREENREIKE